MNNKKKLEFSIVIVCMNNLKNLYPCLDSIKKHTTISYEVLIVAYLFTAENLKQLKDDYPWVNVIESNEIRGYSENNNLALKIVDTNYCFILNDDTFFENDVIKILKESFDRYEDASFFSPLILNYDGTIQDCGRPRFSISSYISMRLRLDKIFNKKNKIIDSIFQTYNISGAAFAVKTEVFKKLEYFDEKYFFCPEDIAVSTLANHKGFKCYVNPGAIIYHRHSNKTSPAYSAIFPAIEMGMLLFLGTNIYSRFFLRVFIYFVAFIKYYYWLFKINNSLRSIMLNSYKNVMNTIFTDKLPKEIFLENFSGFSE